MAVPPMERFSALRAGAMRWCLVVGVLVSCGPPAAGPADPTRGELRASVEDTGSLGTTDDVGGDFTGTGEFKDSVSVAGLETFSIRSEGVGGSQGERFIMHLYGLHRPTPGILPFDLFPTEAVRGDRMGLSGQYALRREDGATEWFFVESGELKITESTVSSVRGTFDVVGVRWCVYLADGSIEGCDDPQVPLDAPRTTAVGLFAAVPQQPRE
jgi:hypothetical protein